MDAVVFSGYMFPELEAATNLNLVPKLRMREVE
jgi:hypothetical protein